ncbi:hypothetical protein BLNAU_10845 [Blattamonas nauphoetae]|uniref:Uncharacterized protein n=1 Tax=Blattamonas nauphoetae TaxID=2049346 RepID=A0ABQ9XSZ5_9EUKA|nr:hypothetical protein BLNAU_10845 [Blattamonas nauphoetae]
MTDADGLSLQAYLTTQCQNIHGSGAWPYMINVVFFSFCLLYSSTEFIQACCRKHRQTNRLRTSFLLVFSIFALCRITFTIAPFPYNFFWGTFLTDQLPKYFLFAAWLVLAIWLSRAFLPTPKRRKQSMAIIIIPLVILIVLMFIACIITTYLTSSNPTKFRHTFNIPNMILNVVLYFIILVSVSVYGIGLIFMFCRAGGFGQQACKMNMLLVMVIVMWIVFFLRFLYGLLKLLNANPIHNIIAKDSSKCEKDDSQCIHLYWKTALLQFIWEIVPSSILLLTLFVIQGVHQPKHVETDEEIGGETKSEQTEPPIKRRVSSVKIRADYDVRTDDAQPSSMRRTRRILVKKKKSRVRHADPGLLANEEAPYHHASSGLDGNPLEDDFAITDYRNSIGYTPVQIDRA